MTVYIGIDPGKSGAIAAIRGHTVWVADLHDATDAEIYEFLMDCHSYEDETVAMIENVHAMPGQGVTSMFSFGENYGALKMALSASGIPFERVTPSVWQRHFSLIRLSSAEKKTDKKNRHKARAQELFPQLKVKHSNADALLIAEYCKRKWIG